LEFADDGPGKILFHGENVVGIPAGKRSVGFVFQHYALFRHMSVADNIAFGLTVLPAAKRPAKREIADRVKELLHLVKLDGLDKRRPHELSGGQRQRAVLARALATEPSLLVCDEPISALDVSIQAQTMNLLVELQDRFGMGILFISHDLRAVRQVSHRVAVMYLGRIVEEGEPDGVLRDPAHPYARALVSAIPHPGRGGQRIVLQGDPPNPADRPTGCAFHPRCAVASAICAREPPALKPRADGRLVACHVAHGEVAPGAGLLRQEAA
jgi:peptide/nickel transport system ATP-binding protein